VDVNLKVTDQPQESSFFDLVSGDSVLSIPLFQRPYTWNKKNLDWLIEDVSDVQSGVAPSVFLGVVVCVSRGATPGRPIPWEIVDGQQRLSTLYLLLVAAAEVGARAGEVAWAAGIIGTYLLVRPLANNPVNTKLVPSFNDRGQFKAIWDGVMSHAPLREHATMAANLPKPPAPSGETTGNMVSQYGRMRTWLKKLTRDQGHDALNRVTEILANNLSIVSISLRDPLVAPKIFERLNNRAELVTVADLVRNEVFSRASDDPALAQHVFSNQWEPFAERFSSMDKGLEKFLFPYGLIINRTTTKADLFATVRSHWQSLAAPSDIIEHMENYMPAFLALEAGRWDEALDPGILKRLIRVHRLGKPSSTYAFIMRLVAAVSANELAPTTASDVLDVIESFLFRRAVCGIEPTGLHAVFKGLWFELLEEEDAQGLCGESVKQAIGGKPTITWPTDAEFEAAIRSGDLYHRKVVTFALTEYEHSCEGETPQDGFQIEHILPQTATPYWTSMFGARYEELVNTWANMIPLTGRMNVQAGQAPFEDKKEEYSDSIFSSARLVAATYPVWSPVELEERAGDLCRWALERWPHASNT
jgi:hypothetical protein